MTSLSKNWIHSNQILGLHVGCGATTFPNWINCDMTVPPHQVWDSTDKPVLRERETAAYFLNHDARLPFPLEPESVSNIYAEHFVEHLSFPEAVTWLREMYRVLAPEGIIRLTTPDLRKYIEGYQDPHHAFFSEHADRLGQSHFAIPRRKGWLFNQIFYHWGHKWIYDFDELSHLAQHAGFTEKQIQQQSFQTGTSPTLYQLDSALRSDESLYVELLKKS